MSLNFHNTCARPNLEESNPTDSTRYIPHVPMERNRSLSADRHTVHKFGNTKSRPLLRPINSRYMRSNCVLTDREIFEMRSVLKEEEEDMEWYKEEIGRVLSLLEPFGAIGGGEEVIGSQY
ncbi:hypothetical protein PM082_007843 [Marasmius tenuissimus]|nr:hypothetical protein PM082_007843 [Marasmius tenuissimus]